MARTQPTWNDAEPTGEVTIVRRSLKAPAREAIRIEVDLDVIVHNARAVQEEVGIGTGVLAVLKANAFGHGLAPVAMALHHGGNITGIVVDSVADALTLAGMRIERPIVCRPADWGRRHAEVVQHGIIPVIATARDLRLFAHAARRSDLTSPVHVDPGTELFAMLAMLARAPELRVVGVHGDPAPFIVAGHRPATIGTTRGCDHVERGLPLFAGALRLVSRIVQLRDLETGEGLGNGWHAPRPSTIATLPVGHLHGYPRRLAGKPEALVHGFPCAIVGAIGAEMMHVDITDLMLPLLGDEVVLFGEQGHEALYPEDVAASVDEMLCGLGRNVARDYVRHPNQKLGGGIEASDEEDIFAA